MRAPTRGTVQQQKWRRVRRCLLALLAQFYPKKWPAQWWIMLVCVLAYGACTLALNAFVSRVEGDAFLFTRPRKARAGPR
jgi:signal peptidase complex subunit 2